MPHVRVAASQQSGWRAVAASALTLLAFAVLAVHVSSRPGSAMGGVQLLDAVSAIGNEAPTSIAMAQPQPPIAGFPFGFDPVSGENIQHMQDGRESEEGECVFMCVCVCVCVCVCLPVCVCLFLSVSV